MEDKVINTNFEESDNDTEKNIETDNKRFDFLPENAGEELLMSFRTVEREYYEKDTTWFILATIFALISIIYFIFDGAFSSAIVFALILSFLYLYGNEPPRLVEIHITSWGVYINRAFYDYKEIKCFWIINDQVNNIHSLHLEVGKNILRIITIQLYDIPDIYIKKSFENYLEEDLEREEPTHNRIKRFFRL